MSKFAVGEKVQIIEAQYPENIGLISSVTSVQNVGFIAEHCGEPVYFLEHHGRGWYSPESRLRKLPGESKEDFIPPEVRKLFVPNKEHEHV